MSERKQTRRTSQRAPNPGWRCAACGKRGTSPTFAERVAALNEHYDLVHAPRSAVAAA